MLSRRRSIVLLAGIVALLVPAVAGASVARDAARIRRGLTQARRAQWLKAAELARYRGDVSLAVVDASRLPRLRGAVVASLLGELALESGSYTSPRALALFGMLETNLQYLETHVLPRGTVDVTGSDGVVYRWFPGVGLQIHPLADFGALNNIVQSGDLNATRTLADALVARGVPRGPALRWEYYFPYGGGRPPWVSGMAQAVAAQALSRASALLQDPALLQAAGRAYAAVPAGLVQQLDEGPWIRLYSFDREVVFNAQLQSILSLQDYAQATGDANAAALAASMTVAAQALLPRFDTGYWSLYELGGSEAPLGYEQYVTQLLIKLAQRTQDPVWEAAAARFYAYLRQPPQLAFPPPVAPVTLYPDPADGFLDSQTFTFTLSKRSRVTLAVAGRTVAATLGRGTHTLTWKPGPAFPPGSYAAQLSAVDLAGNRTTVAYPVPIAIARVTAPPQVQATWANGVLQWQGVDPTTPWLRLVLTLQSDAGTQTVKLGLHSLNGTSTKPLPSGTWNATLAASNSAGLTTTVDLGTITVP